MLTTALLDQIKADVKDDLEALFTNGAVGTDDTATAPSDTALGAEVFDDVIDEFDQSPSDKVIASFRILTTEANGNTIAECGWFDADPDTTGTMMSRNLVNSIAKTSDIQLFLDTSITIVIEED